ncbi:MAG: redox-sensing transcriptional repressor Rex [Actinobacteria bacterium]|nr:redox-sensing transcriptional repressor Rex [Actinomycetota bacterium]
MVSRKTVGRLSLYKRLLESLRAAGAPSVYSHQLADLAGVSATVVRRDFMVIGYTGSPNRGYEVETCLASIKRFLAGASRQEIALVGVGRLGKALLAHFSELPPLLQITAGFDTDPEICGTSIDGCPIHSVSELRQTVAARGIRVGIIAVPPVAAQDVAIALVEAGVLSIVTFSATALQVPEQVFVEYLDITSALESAAYFAQEGLAKAAAEEAGETAADLVIREIDSHLDGAGLSLEDLAGRIGARIIVSGEQCTTTVDKIYAGDRVSDLLQEASDRTLLVTKLANLQIVRVAELIDVPGICFVDGTNPSPEIVDMAQNNGTLLMVSPLGIFETCGRIFQNLCDQKPG